MFKPRPSSGKSIIDRAIFAFVIIDMLFKFLHPLQKISCASGIVRFEGYGSVDAIEHFTVTINCIADWSAFLL